MRCEDLFGEVHLRSILEAKGQLSGYRVSDKEPATGGRRFVARGLSWSVIQTVLGSFHVGDASEPYLSRKDPEPASCPACSQMDLTQFYLGRTLLHVFFCKGHECRTAPSNCKCPSLHDRHANQKNSARLGRKKPSVGRQCRSGGIEATLSPQATAFNHTHVVWTGAWRFSSTEPRAASPQVVTNFMMSLA